MSLTSTRRSDEQKKRLANGREGSPVLDTPPSKRTRNRSSAPSPAGKDHKMGAKDGFLILGEKAENVSRNPQARQEKEGEKEKCGMEGVMGENCIESRRGEEKVSCNEEGLANTTRNANSISGDKGLNGGSRTVFFDFEAQRLSASFKKDEIWAMYDEYGMPRCYAQITKDGCSNSTTFSILKKQYTSGIFPACGVFKLDSHQGSLFYPTAFSHKLVEWETTHNSNKITFRIYPIIGEVWAITTCINSTPFSWNTTPTIQQYQLVEVLMCYSDKALKVGYLSKVKGGYRSLFQRYRGDESFKIPVREFHRFSHQVPYSRVTVKGTVGDFLELDPASLPLYIDDFAANVNPKIDDKYLCSGLLDNKIYQKQIELSYPTVWAAYDDRYGLPLRYVRILKKSDPNLGLEITELEPYPVSEHERRWYEAGLPIACGRFTPKISVSTLDHHKFFKEEITAMISHKVIGQSGEYWLHDIHDIHPRKGNVWGIYKEWNVGKSCNLTGIGREFEYEIVEITGDYCKVKGITVVYLIRVGGFKSVFRRKTSNGKEVQFKIPANELYRFSHQIPACRLHAKQNKGFLEGSLVLDPVLVPEKEGEHFTFNDSTLLEKPNARLAIQHLIEKEKNESSLENQEKTHPQSEVYGINITESLEKQEDLSLNNPGQRVVVLDEISNVEVRGVPDDLMLRKQGHGFQEMEEGAVESGEEIPSSEPVNIYKHPNIKFHDFVDWKLAKDFDLGQIWALHDDFDGLPRSYARINKLIPSEEKVEVTLLEPHPIADEEMHWIEENLPLACGTFRASKSTAMKRISVFSHRVVCEDDRALRSFRRIFPIKGEVWAIYKNWDVSWTYSDFKNNLQYKLVEVMSDFTEEAGITVAALSRVEGHEAVFERHLHEGFGLVQTFSRKELLRFSHCISALNTVSDKKANSLKGSLKIKFSHQGI